MKINKTILISGIPPGRSGTGRFLEYIKKNFSDLFQFIFLDGPYDHEIRKELENLSSHKILLFHPQTIGFKTFKELVLKNKCFLYVLDNSFFCGASYNYIKGENQSCFRCLENRENEIKYNCVNTWNFDDFTEFAEKIFYFAQNESQKKLLLKKFGTHIQVIVLGMNVLDDISDKPLPNPESGYDIVFHANKSFAKGYEFARKLDNSLSDFSIYFPEKGETWETGLKEKVQNAKIVINPSLWSAPVEGALLKSIKYNGCVAVTSTEGSFVEEISDNTLLKLNPENINESLLLLLNLLNNKKKRDQIRKLAKNWLTEHQKQATFRIKSIFKRKFEYAFSSTRKFDNRYFDKQNEFHECKISLEDIKGFLTYSVFCLSEQTKHLLKYNYIKPDYIFDNNHELHGMDYGGIKILSTESDELKHSRNIIIISNHSKNIYKDLLELPFVINNIKILI